MSTPFIELNTNRGMLAVGKLNWCQFFAFAAENKKTHADLWTNRWSEGSQNFKVPTRFYDFPLAPL